VDGKVRRFQAGEALEKVGPILLCQGIHLAVEGRQTAVGVFHFAILVAIDMD